MKRKIRTFEGEKIVKMGNIEYIIKKNGMIYFNLDDMISVFRKAKKDIRKLHEEWFNL